MSNIRPHKNSRKEFFYPNDEGVATYFHNDGGSSIEL